jgi:acetolactate synthase-1/2/3 large subunit
MCFTGDGGFWYHLSDLETAVRCGIKTVTVINNNNRFGQVAVGIDKAYGDRPGNREEMYSFREVNFARIAEEMGCLGIRVESPEKIRGALERALSSDLPAVVEVITDKDIPAPWAQSY